MMKINSSLVVLASRCPTVPSPARGGGTGRGHHHTHAQANTPSPPLPRKRERGQAESASALCLAIVAAFAFTLASPARADGDAARGEAKFQECAACHTLQDGVNNVGPSLHGLFGRKAGTLADFRYSPAMKRSGITWTPQALDTFIADPQAAVPANRMPYAGLSDKAARDDLIAYLQKATQ